MSAFSKFNLMARHRAHCREVRGQMSEYIDGELDAAAGRGIERHLRWCHSCRRMLANLRRTVDGLHALGTGGGAYPPASANRGG